MEPFVLEEGLTGTPSTQQLGNGKERRFIRIVGVDYKGTSIEFVLSSYMINRNKTVHDRFVWLLEGAEE